MEKYSSCSPNGTFGVHRMGATIKRVHSRGGGGGGGGSAKLPSRATTFFTSLFTSDADLLSS